MASNMYVMVDFNNSTSLRLEVIVVWGRRPTHHMIACLAFEGVLFVCEQRLWLMVRVVGQLPVVLCCLISGSTQVWGSQWKVNVLGGHMNYVYKPHQNLMPCNSSTYSNKQLSHLYKSVHSFDLYNPNDNTSHFLGISCSAVMDCSYLKKTHILKCEHFISILLP